MNSVQKNTGLSKVCELIASRLGLHFPEERQGIFTRNLSQAAKELGFQNDDHFINWLLTNRLDKKQIGIFASYLTISETFFWREPMVFSALVDFIFPEMVASRKNGDKNIRIWSAGCSTGEEPYSLAIALCKAIPDLSNWNISILASDINSKALDKAREGRYSKWSFRNCPKWVINDYFIRRDEKTYEILPKIRKMVNFVNLNLVEDNYPSAGNHTNDMDIIFCRNVLMYFTDDRINKISRQLYQSLKNDGWLAVASCELSSLVFSRFSPVNFSGAILYRKGNKKIPITPPLKPVTKKFYFPVPETDNRSDQASEKPQLIDDSREKETTTENIRVLANQGRLAEALAACNQRIGTDKLDKNLYFLRASIFQEMEQPEESIASLKQAIYLDPDFIMAHLALGNLYLRNGQTKHAKKHLRNVLTMLKSFSNEDILPGSEGLSASYIRGIVQDNLREEI